MGDGGRDWDAREVGITSARAVIRPFTAGDADEVLACITPAITRWMSWEVPSSPEAFALVWLKWLPSIDDGTDLHFVVRRLADGRCLGLVGLHRAQTEAPELGIWIREDVHGQGFGREAVAAVAAWASENLHPSHFEYPVAEENAASRRIAEHLGGSVVARRSNPKYVSVVYRIPAPRAGEGRLVQVHDRNGAIDVAAFQALDDTAKHDVGRMSSMASMNAVRNAGS